MVTTNSRDRSLPSGNRYAGAVGNVNRHISPSAKCPRLWPRERWGMCVALTETFCQPGYDSKLWKSKCCQESTWESCPSSPNTCPYLVGQNRHGEWDTPDFGKMAESGRGAPGDRGAVHCGAILRPTWKVCCFCISWWLIFLCKC